ncbi:hypothetical protein [Paracoccus indicus]|uniref:hypothetical protein n=1 Tax=Paracoccus indicus TaxID=2079229 RepID=UPI000D39FDE7|nr:hypothetical protein [Paracoccus indicus]
MPKHRYMWERQNGPILEEHVPKCLNDDKTNWQATPQGMLPRLNARWKSVKYDDAPADLKPEVMAVAKLDHAVRVARKAQRRVAKES